MIGFFFIILVSFPIYLCLRAAISPKLALAFGSLTFFISFLPLTWITDYSAYFFEAFGVIHLLLLALIEEVVRVTGLRTLWNSKNLQDNSANQYDFVVFGVAFGFSEYLIRMLGHYYNGYLSCGVLSFGSACSASFEIISITALHAVTLHVLLTLMYAKISLNQSKPQLRLVLPATAVHWGVNLFSIRYSNYYFDNETLPIAFIVAIAAYLFSIYYRLNFTFPSATSEKSRSKAE